jgi:pimeloyl-ACP methyl ester carboxylesterase
MDMKNDLFNVSSGDPQGKVILFLHGSPLTHKMWRPQLEALTEYRCIAVDLPGHGQSAAIPFDMDDCVQRLTAIIQRESPRAKVDLVGLSFGGVVAQALMVQQPDLLDRVILSGTSSRLSKFMVWTQSLNEPLLRMMKPRQLASMVAGQFGIPGQYLEDLSSDFDKFSVDVFSKMMQTYGDIVMPVDFSSPTLVCVGSRETPVAKMMARKIARALPAGKGITIPGGTHVWNMQMPDLFNQVVRAWFGGGPLPEHLVGF